MFLFCSLFLDTKIIVLFINKMQIIAGDYKICYTFY